MTGASDGVRDRARRGRDAHGPIQLVVSPTLLKLESLSVSVCISCLSVSTSLSVGECSHRHYAVSLDASITVMRNFWSKAASYRFRATRVRWLRRGERLKLCHFRRILSGHRPTSATWLRCKRPKRPTSSKWPNKSSTPKKPKRLPNSLEPRLAAGTQGLGAGTSNLIIITLWLGLAHGILKLAQFNLAFGSAKSVVG